MSIYTYIFHRWIKQVNGRPGVTRIALTSFYFFILFRVNVGISLPHLPTLMNLNERYKSKQILFIYKRLFLYRCLAIVVLRLNCVPDGCVCISD